MGDLYFVTGGARSGKSRFAVALAARLAARHGSGVAYLATMQPLDAELEARVARHRDERPAAWRTIEAPLDLLAGLATADSSAVVLLDCLSLWVTNHLLSLGESPSPAETGKLETHLLGSLDDLLRAASARPGALILVTNEVGDGVVPDTVLGRAFRDLLGVANQRAASHAAQAWLLVAGRPLPLPAPEASPER